MKFLFLVVVVGLMLSQVASFRTRPPSAMNWNADSGRYPDVDIDLEEESSDEEDLKLDWHHSAPVIYSAPSRVVYAHHTSQADPLEDASEENYDIGEHAPGPPMLHAPGVYSNNDYGSEEEMSIEDSKMPQFLSTQAPLQLDTRSPKYVPPPVVYSPPVPMPSAYMNPTPIPVVTAGSFYEYPVSSIDNVMNIRTGRPKSLISQNNIPAPAPIAYNPPTPAPIAYNPPTPSPIVFNGPNSNAAIYSKPPIAQVVYKYALPSPVVNKEEESFPQHKEQTYYYEDDNTPDPMIYDSSEYSIAIDNESKFAPYMYSDLISPSNAFADTFSSHPPQKFTSFNHITPGFAKPAKDHSFLNLYAKPKQYDIEPFPISPLADSIPKINGKPALISKPYTVSKDNSETYTDLKDSNNFNSIEYEDIDHDILDVIPITYNDPVVQQSFENLNEFEVKDTPTLPIITKKETEDFDDIEYDDVDHDILDSIPVAYNEPKLQPSKSVPEDTQVKIESAISNLSNGISSQGESMEDTVSKVYVVQTEITTTQKPISPANIMNKGISNQDTNDDSTMKLSRKSKIPEKIVTPIKASSSLSNRLSRFSSRRGSQRSPGYSRRMSSFRSSLRGSQRQRYRDRSSEEKTRNIYSFNRSSEEKTRNIYSFRRSSEEKTRNIYSFRRSSEEKTSSFRNRLRYTTRGGPVRRPMGRFYNLPSLENYSSEERVPTRRRTNWGRRRQYRPAQSSEEDDDDDDDNKRTRTRVSSRLNTRKQEVRTTTVKPSATTVKSRQISSRGRSILSNRNRNRSPAKQSLQCFLMSIVRTNYEC